MIDQHSAYNIFYFSLTWNRWLFLLHKFLTVMLKLIFPPLLQSSWYCMDLSSVQWHENDARWQNTDVRSFIQNLYLQDLLLIYPLAYQSNCVIYVFSIFSSSSCHHIFVFSWCKTGQNYTLHTRGSWPCLFLCHQ